MRSAGGLFRKSTGAARKQGATSPSKKNIAPVEGKTETFVNEIKQLLGDMGHGTRNLSP